jgi:uncharacterized RDD family membrane protein YckC
VAFCSKCGANVGEGSPFCSVCGQAQPGGPPRVAPQPSGGPIPTIGNAPAMPAPPQRIVGCAVLEPRQPFVTAYAGFWLRFVAWFIDAIVLGIGGGILTAPITGVSLFNLHSLMHGRPPSPDEFFGHGFIFRAFFVKQLLHWVYYALLESSTWQATLGKKALGLEVTDMQGTRISFGHATGRWAARYISVMTFGIGYIMAGFTARKQALHDLIAGTLVIRKI